MIQKNTLSRLIKFYELMPLEIIDDISEKIFSREEKREFKKTKNKNEKILYFLKNELNHIKFITELNSIYNNKEYEDFDNIKKFISETDSKDDLTSKTIYIIYKHIVYNTITKDAFREFIESNEFNYLFDTTLKESSLSNLNHKDSVFDMSKPKKEIKNMKKYLCFIESKESTNYSNSFSYYIYPQFWIEKEHLIHIDNPQSEFPNYGNIFLDDPNRTFHKFIKELQLENELCVIEFDINELEKNIVDGNQKPTNFKIDSHLLVSNNRITKINQNNIYKLVYSKNTTIALEFEEINIISENYNIKANDLVYQKYEEFLYGPFTVNVREYDNVMYIKPLNIDYIINKYNLESFETPQIISCGKKEENLNIVYIHTPDKYCLVDVMPEKKVFDQFKNYLINNTVLSKDELTKFSNHLKQSYEIDIIRNSDKLILEKRLNKINDIFENTLLFDKHIDELSKIINNLILNKSKEENFSDFINLILSDSELSRNLQKVKLVQKKVEDYNSEIEELSRKIETLKLKKSEFEKLLEEKDEEYRLKIDSMDYQEIKDKEKELHRLEIEIDESYKQKEEYTESINQLILKYDLIYDYVEINKNIDKNRHILTELENELSYNERRNGELKSQIDKFDKSLNEKIQTVPDKMNEINIDGMIANKLLKESSDWENNNIKSKFLEIAKYTNNIEHDLLEKNIVREYIYNKISSQRNYDRNEIYNIMICITQGFLTVFAGDPGVGKTSICNIIGDSLGLSNFGMDYKLDNINLSRYIPISVERGWTSKRDLIGYFNPLTKKFDKSNKKLFNGLNILNFESNESKFPFIILLDEANLSPMEYYWADFMNVCDDIDINNHRYINLGENYIFNIPKTLRFLATINYDHTTEVFSPRLIDRSWIIKLIPNNKSNPIDNNDCIVENMVLSWRDLENAFSHRSYDTTTIDSEIKEVLELIYELFSKHNSPIGIRTKNNIKNYLLVGQNIFEGNSITNEKFIALDYAISQRILPKINGYGEKYKDFLSDFLKICDRNNLMKSKYSLHMIIEKGISNMEYYQFFC